MNLEFRRSIRYEIVLNMTLLAIFGLMLSGFVVYKLLEQHLILQEVGNAKFYCRMLENKIESLIMRESLAPVPNSPVSRVLLEALREPRLWQIVIFDAQGRQLMQVGREIPDFSEDQKDMQRQDVLAAMISRNEEVRFRIRIFELHPLVMVAFPIAPEQHQWGGAVATFELLGIGGISPKIYPYFFVYLLVVSGVLAVFGSVLMSKLIIQPILQLVQGTRRLSQGELHTSVNIQSENELGELAQSFNEMSKRLGSMIEEREHHLKALESTNEELLRTQSELVRNEKLAMLGRIAAGVAHEIGNPIGAIMGYADILKAGGVDETTQKDFFERISRESLRIDRIIRDLLEISRPSKRKAAPLSVNYAVTTTWEIVSAQELFRQVNFEFVAHGDQPKVNADLHPFQQILINLFSNAVRAMGPKGTLTVEVKTGMLNEYKDIHAQAGALLEHLSEKAEVVVIRVTDTGPGIESALFSQIFEPFFSTRDPGEGTGLGLYIVARLVETLQGIIAVDNGPGGGAQFTLIFPRES